MPGAPLRRDAGGTATSQPGARRSKGSLSGPSTGLEPSHAHGGATSGLTRSARPGRRRPRTDWSSARRWPGVLVHLRRVNRMGFPVGAVLRPEILLLLPVVLSIAAWSVPGQSLQLRGFTTRSAISLPAVFIITAWYVACLLMLRGGSRLGSRLAPWKTVDAATEGRRERIFYLTLTAVSTIGVGSAITTAVMSGAVTEAIATANWNALNASIGARAGIATLRYASAVAAPYAVWMFFRRQTGPVGAIWNVVLMLANTTFSSRLTLMLACLTALFLFSQSRRDARIRVVPGLVVMIVMFGALAVFNWMRNATYYQHFGVSNPIAMNYYQIASYLGAPFQASLGMADAIVNAQLLPQPSAPESLQVIVPAFFRTHMTFAEAAARAAHNYPTSVDVAANLTTNSTFADTLADYGWLGLLATLAAVALVGFIFGRASRYPNRQLLHGAVALYGVAEIWRIFLFTQGIFLFLLLIVVAADVVARVLTPGSRLHRATRAHTRSFWRLSASRRAGRRHTALEEERGRRAIRAP